MSDAYQRSARRQRRRIAVVAFITCAGRALLDRPAGNVSTRLVSSGNSSNKINIDVDGRGLLYGDGVTSCSLSVLLMDPRIPYLPVDDVMYTSALESLGEHAPPNACFILQVTKCVMEHHLLRGLARGSSDNEVDDERAHTRHDVPEPGGWTADVPRNSTHEEEIRRYRSRGDVRNLDSKVLQDALYDNVRDRAGPNFRRRMDAGRVRVVPLDHWKYGFSSCLSFYNPSLAWTNHGYYGEDSFVEGIDSDLALFFQQDGVLCRPLREEDLDVWREFAWVGGPVSQWFGGPKWQKRMRGWSEQVSGKGYAADWVVGEDGQETSTAEGTATTNYFVTDFEKNYPYGKVMVGNGGVSLRSRKWMRRAIRTCPHVMYSRLGLGDGARWPDDTNCTIFNGPTSEDVYFSVSLALMGAPIPPPFVASLFSIDQLVPDVVAAYAGPQSELEQSELVSKYWNNGSESVELYRRMVEEDGHPLPIFVHKAATKRGLDGGEYWPKMKRRCKYIDDTKFPRGGGR